MVIENRGVVTMRKFVSIQVEHGDDVHVLDPSFPMSNLMQFSPKMDRFFRNEPDAKKYTIKVSAHIPYDSLPFHRVIDLIRRTSLKQRDDVDIKVAGLSLSQITQSLLALPGMPIEFLFADINNASLVLESPNAISIPMNFCQFVFQTGQIFIIIDLAFKDSKIA